MSINFIKPVSPKKQEEFNRWIKFSCFSTLILGAILCSINVYQGYLITVLHQKKQLLQTKINELSTTKQKYAEQQTKQKLIAQKIERIANDKHLTEKSKMMLAELSKTIPEDVALEHVTYINENIELQGHAFTSKSVLLFTQILNKSKLFLQVELKSLQQGIMMENGQSLVRFTLNGIIKS